MATKLEQDLRVCGCEMDPCSFVELLEEMRGQLYPNLSLDGLLGEPHLAVQFCNAVRSRISCAVIDRIITDAMLNGRKHKRKKEAEHN